MDRGAEMNLGAASCEDFITRMIVWAWHRPERGGADGTLCMAIVTGKPCQVYGNLGKRAEDVYD